MKLIMIPMMKLLGPVTGMSGPIEQAAARYVQAADFPKDQNGRFFATAHRRRLVGPIAAQSWPEYFLDERAQEAGLQAMIRLTGTPLPEAAN
jgi:hypothetical protein